MRIGDNPSNIVFFTENENLKATIYKDSISSSFVTGGKQNELYVAYNKEVASMMKERLATNKAYQQAQAEQDGILVNELRQKNISLATKERAFKRNFVKENGNSIFGLMLASELYQKEELNSNEVKDLITKLGPKLATHDLVTDLQMMMEANKKAEIGGMAPLFSAPDPDGNELALKDAMGKYTIIDFWASWCRPCRMENPNVVNVYNKYHDKGLNIISVSLDKAGQKERWLKAIEDDKMDWYHVSNLKFWQDPIAKQYRVRSIPATFLLDEKGNIIDKNLRGPALEAKIASLLD
jgi:thiol-disulfide isomerase/thioredoxin